ncbi:MAG: leucine-rich repeat domain-containing protein [Bacteroidetes bacterium]|nr:leucine-rich repeat domain-containing protein [Bacteroidota bacterium]
MHRALYYCALLLLFGVAACDEGMTDTTDPYHPYFSLEEALKDSATAEYLYLEHIGDSLSPEIGKLENLLSLHVSYSDIRYMPSEIQRLKRLEILVLSSDSFENIPSQIFKLGSLGNLMMNYNNIRSLPQAIFSMPKLTGISLNGNRFTVFPDRLIHMGAVDALFLDSNRISTINIDSLDAPNLKVLSLKYNPIPVYMREQLRQRLPDVDIRF